MIKVSQRGERERESAGEEEGEDNLKLRHLSKGKTEMKFNDIVLLVFFVEDSIVTFVVSSTPTVVLSADNDPPAFTKSSILTDPAAAAVANRFNNSEFVAPVSLTMDVNMPSSRDKS